MPLRLRRGTDTERQTITPAEAELIYVTDTEELWIGDGTTQGGKKVTGTIPSDLNDLDNVDLTTPPTNGQVLKWNGSSFAPADDIDTTLNLGSLSIGDLGDVDLSITPQIGQTLKWNGTTFIPANDIDTDTAGIVEGSNYRINIIADDSTVMVDTANQNLNGSVTGDVIGSVFANDSSLIIDSINNNIFTSELTSPILNSDIINSSSVRFQSNILNQDARIDLLYKSNSDESNSIADRGKIYFSRDDINGKVVEAIVAGGRGGFYVLVDDGSETYPQSNIMLLNNAGNLSLGTINSVEKLTVEGGIFASGEVKGAALKGTLTLDDSTIVIDGISGSIVAPSYIQFGRFTTTERNTITAENGMIIYNTTTNRFEGYQNGVWINLDNGTPA